MAYSLAPLPFSLDYTHTPPASSISDITHKLKTGRLLQAMGLENFSKEFSVKFHRHSKHPNLVFMKHEGTWLRNTNDDVDVVRECNGLVLDEGDNWNVVCLPYFKFLYRGTIGMESIDWRTARVYNKVDGNLCVLFHHKGDWFVSSKNSLESADQMTDKKQALHSLFWEIWHGLGYKNPSDTNMCFMFELVHPHHRYGVKYYKPNIILHGVRDMHTLDEIDPQSVAACYGWAIVDTVKIDPLTLADVQNCASKLNPYVSEGFVVVDAQFRRILLKSPRYVALTCLRTLEEGLPDLNATRASNRALLDMTRNNEEGEFSAYFPQYTEWAMTVRQKFEKVVADIDNTLLKFTNLSAKDFAMAVQTSRLKSALFAIRKTAGHSTRAYLAMMDLKSLVSYVFEGENVQ